MPRLSHSAGQSAESACIGKAVFASFTQANKLRTHNAAPYRCQYCQQWHVGTILRRKNKSKNRKTIRIL